jgi:lipopolysaccharide transport system ATP-binding protein
MEQPVISVQNLSKKYYLEHQNQEPSKASDSHLNRIKRWIFNKKIASKLSGDEIFWALKNISFDIYHGERVGVIGKNGAGKSTLLKILSRLVYPTTGEAIIRGRVTSLLEVGTGFNNNLSGRDNIYLNASLHGLNRAEVDRIFEDIVDFSGTGQFLDTPVKHYSSGMKMRLAFSVAAHLDPDILLLDEVLAVGDMSFQQKCLNRVEGLTSEGRTVLFVSHSMDSVTRFCDRCIWIDKGEILKDGTAEDVVSIYVQKVMGVKPEKQWAEATTGDQKPPRTPEPISETSETEAPDVTENNSLEGANKPGKSNEELDSHGGHDPDEVKTNSPDDGIKPEQVRLLSTRVIDADGKTVSSISVHQKVGIEVLYEILNTDQNIQPALHFKVADGTIAFVVAYTDTQYKDGLPCPGQYKSIAWVPPNLLNIGVLYVNLVMVTPDPLEEHIFIEDALSFNVHERTGDFLTARGSYARDFPGYVRPLLTWETTAS